MRRNETGYFYGGLAAIVVCGLLTGTAATAGTVYSWKTEDGTYAFTNERKRIPAKYKGEAKTRKVGDLDSYERYTPVSQGDYDDYGQRMERRLESLRRSTRQEEVADRRGHPRGKQEPGIAISTGGGRYGGGNRTTFMVPKGGDGEGLVTVEQIRVKSGQGRITTRTLQVVRRGDEVVAVIKPEYNDGPIASRHEDDFDPNPIDQR